MPDSKAQVRWAHAVAQGDVKGDKGFAQEVISKMHGKKMSSLSERKSHAPRGNRKGR